MSRLNSLHVPHHATAAPGHGRLDDAIMTMHERGASYHPPHRPSHPTERTMDELRDRLANLGEHIAGIMVRL